MCCSATKCFVVDTASVMLGPRCQWSLDGFDTHLDPDIRGLALPYSGEKARDRPVLRAVRAWLGAGACDLRPTRLKYMHRLEQHLVSARKPGCHVWMEFQGQRSCELGQWQKRW